MVYGWMLIISKSEFRKFMAFQIYVPVAFLSVFLFQTCNYVTVCISANRMSGLESVMEQLVQGRRH